MNSVHRRPLHGRIICIGNRLFAADSAGPLVYDILQQTALPPGIDLIDGGLGGLNLLPFLEQTDLVLFVDSVSGFQQDGGVLVIDPLHDLYVDETFGHDSGLAFLLHAAPKVLDEPLPAVYLVGIDGPPLPRYCRQAAEECLRLLQENKQERSIGDAQHRFRGR